MEKLVISKLDAEQYIRLECLRMATELFRVDPRMLLARMAGGAENPLSTLEACARDMERFVHHGFMVAPKPEPTKYRREEIKDDEGAGAAL